MPIDITVLEPSSAVLGYKGLSARSSDGDGPRIPTYESIMSEYQSPLILGYFTKYGDVSPLLLENDDKFVIMAPGDEISLEFDEKPLVEGLGRSYYFYYNGFYKGMGGSKAMGEPFISPLPLPFGNENGVGVYPYKEEDYPYADDEDYQDYINTWNTRQVIIGN